MYLGATTWTFSWAPPYDEPIKRIAKLGGFKSVELTIWNEEFLKIITLLRPINIFVPWLRITD